MRAGDVILWVMVDRETGEMVMRCHSRRAARRWARSTGGRVAKLIVAK